MLVVRVENVRSSKELRIRENISERSRSHGGGALHGRRCYAE